MPRLSSSDGEGADVEGDGEVNEHQCRNVLMVIANEGTPGPLVGLGGDEPSALEDPPDGGHGGDRLVSVLQVEGDGVSPGVQTLIGQVPVQAEDLLLERRPGLPWAVFWPARAWL